jgi:peptidoglycan hydrolase CwlO-like protein
VDTNDNKTIENLQQKIQDISGRLNLLKNERDNLKSDMMRLDSEILMENQENIEYLYELDKKSPRAPIR